MSIEENPKRHGKSYSRWLGDRAKPSHRGRLRTAIDPALVQKTGYVVKPGPALEILKFSSKFVCQSILTVIVI